jgi:hypothetical protein
MPDPMRHLTGTIASNAPPEPFPDDPRDAALGILRELWNDRCRGDLDIDMGEWLDSKMEAAGLAVWRPATAKEAAEFDGHEEGDFIIVLTPEGKSVLG